MNKKDVVVVIPIYKTYLSEVDSVSLNQNISILKGYDLCFIAPENLSTKCVDHFNIRVERFEDSYFDGVQGYNTLMMSQSFYQRFADYSYILICQTDAYIFKDELSYWVAQNYDYIGAPWLAKAKYRKPHYRIFLKLKSLICTIYGARSHDALLLDKVGNGGLSLRKVDSFISSLESNKLLVKRYLKRSKKQKEFNEDVYWSLENPNFRYPHWKEALNFAIDARPEYAIELISDSLPFGCHGWDKPHAQNFWNMGSR